MQSKLDTSWDLNLNTLSSPYLKWSRREVENQFLSFNLFQLRIETNAIKEYKLLHELRQRNKPTAGTHRSGRVLLLASSWLWWHVGSLLSPCCRCWPGSSACWINKERNGYILEWYTLVFLSYKVPLEALHELKGHRQHLYFHSTMHPVTRQAGVGSAI